MMTLQQRIRERREAFGASLEDAAAWSVLSAARWQAIEAGDSLSAGELWCIARALAVDPGALLRGEEQSPRRSVARFRQAVPLDGPRVNEARTLALAAEHGRIGGALYGMLEKRRPLADGRAPMPVSDGVQPWRQGYRLAEAARRGLGIPVGPISDLQATLEMLGIHVALLPFARPEIDAASLMEEGAMPMLLLNTRSPRIEQILPRRTAMAHELCHLLYDGGEHDLETQVSRNSESLTQGDAVEQRARAFAPAFLAPRDEVRQWFERGDGRKIRDEEGKIAALAARWGLSRRGAVWHAKNCGLIGPETAERLVSEPGAAPQTWEERFETAPTPDPTLGPALDDADVVPLCRGRLAALTYEAYRAAAISEGRAREILSWA